MLEVKDFSVESIEQAVEGLYWACKHSSHRVSGDGFLSLVEDLKKIELLTKKLAIMGACDAGKKSFQDYKDARTIKEIAAEVAAIEEKEEKVKDMYLIFKYLKLAYRAARYGKHPKDVGFQTLKDALKEREEEEKKKGKNENAIRINILLDVLSECQKMVISD